MEAIKTHGFGLSSVRFICGTQVCVGGGRAGGGPVAAAHAAWRALCTGGTPSSFKTFKTWCLVNTKPHMHMPRVMQDLHKQLEARISEFHGTEDTILYPSCFDANVRAACFWRRLPHSFGCHACYMCHACPPPCTISVLWLPVTIVLKAPRKRTHPNPTTGGPV